jgi:hypothetical protein
MPLIIEQIIECCGKDIAWEIEGEDTLEMYMTRTGQHFKVKEGDTWGVIKKRIQSSAVADKKKGSSVREHWIGDGWADMTEELLKPMTYEQKEQIHICATTKVSALNMFWICEKIIRYCRDDLTVHTKLTKDTIEVCITERGGEFTVEIGDTWFEIREQIHCC